MLADWEHVVEVEAVICGVLDCVVVDWHTTQPADCMLCLALVEECGLVFFELAACLARSSWHVVTALWCFGLESNQRLCGVHCLFIITGIRLKGSHGR